MAIYNTYLVCYDVADNKRRKKLFDFLKDIGLEGLQESVFYGYLKKPEEKSLQRFLDETLKKGEDKCLIIQCLLDEKVLLKSFGYRHWNLRKPDESECI